MSLYDALKTTKTVAGRVASLADSAPYIVSGGRGRPHNISRTARRGAGVVSSAVDTTARRTARSIQSDIDFVKGLRGKTNRLSDQGIEQVRAMYHQLSGQISKQLFGGRLRADNLRYPKHSQPPRRRQ